MKPYFTITKKKKKVKRILRRAKSAHGAPAAFGSDGEAEGSEAEGDYKDVDQRRSFPFPHWPLLSLRRER